MRGFQRGFALRTLEIVPARPPAAKARISLVNCGKIGKIPYERPPIGRASRDRGPEDASVEVTPETLRAQGSWSAVQTRFAEFFLSDPECHDESAFAALAERDSFLRYDLQRWLMFLGPAKNAELAKATTDVCRLVLEIPRRVFAADPGALSEFYRIPPEVSPLITDLVIKTDCLTDLIARADLIWSADGLKVCEVNAAGNLGGWEVGGWHGRYRRVPPLARFLDREADRVGLTDPLDESYAHFIAVARKRGLAESGELHLAMTSYEAVNSAFAAFIDQGYRAALAKHLPGAAGRFVLCRPEEVIHRGGRLEVGGLPVQLVLDASPEQFNRSVYTAMMDGNAFCWNGPLATLLSQKTNLALLSELEADGGLSPEDAETVRRHFPWTRRVVGDYTDYRGEREYLPDLMVEHRKSFVLKAGLSSSGLAVHLGRNMTPSAWQALIDKALDEGEWIVQEFADSLPFLLGDAKGNPAWQDIVWGTFDYGGRYAGAFLRHKPCEQEGIINAAQGATIGVYYDATE